MFLMASELRNESGRPLMPSQITMSAASSRLQAGHLRDIGGSSLTDPGIPWNRRNLERTDIPTSYVPFRNAHLLSIATSWGEVLGAEALFIGAVAEDSSGYPDCRPEYYQAFNELIRVGTRPETRLEIMTPCHSHEKRAKSSALATSWVPLCISLGRVTKTASGPAAGATAAPCA
jgi:7-cyano-7-deazaguanine synthase in queuosine biosynthesis